MLQLCFLVFSKQRSLFFHNLHDDSYNKGLWVQMKSFKVKTLDSGQRPPWSAKPQVMPSLSQVCVCCHPVLLFFILEKFYWSIISLQCCVGFCYTTMWISYKYAFIPPSRGFPNGSASKESTSNAEDTSSGGGNGNTVQYSCLWNPMDRGTWWDIIYGVAKSWI